MQIIADLQKRVQHLLSENATTILTAGGVVGTVTTAVLTARATFKAAELIEDAEGEASMEETRRADRPATIEFTKKEKVMLVWPLYIPPVLTGGVTIGSIVLANRMSGQKAAALAAAYGLSQRQLEEYKTKVSERLGIQKEQKIQDELAQDRVGKTPGASQIVVVEGEVLCFDQPTGRYFRSTMENINKAVNATNAEILHHDYASASYFYEELGLPATTWTDDVGWNTDQLVDLAISTVMSDDNRPCIAIDFKTLPKLDYVPKHY